MKKITLALALCLMSAAASYAIGINIGKGISGYAGGCFSGAGVCMELPDENTISNASIFHDAGSNTIRMEIPPGDPYYDQIQGSIQIGQGCDVPLVISQQLGFQDAKIYIVPGAYPAVRNSQGIYIVEFPWDREP